MTEIEIVQQLYPELLEKDNLRYFYGPSDYSPMVNSFGEILIEQHCDDYQGDSWILLKNNDLYGYLCFGWGSCSGCDALQGCESIEEVAEIYTRLRDSITWRTKEETIKWFDEHDWEGDYGSFYKEDQKKFLDNVQNYFLLFANEHVKDQAN